MKTIILKQTSFHFLNIFKNQRKLMETFYLKKKMFLVNYRESRDMFG